MMGDETNPAAAREEMMVVFVLAKECRRNARVASLALPMSDFFRSANRSNLYFHLNRDLHQLIALRCDRRNSGMTAISGCLETVKGVMLMEGLRAVEAVVVAVSFPEEIQLGNRMERVVLPLALSVV